jgi:hypothetical protein
MAGKVTGKQIRDDSLTGDDIDESTLIISLEDVCSVGATTTRDLSLSNIMPNSGSSFDIGSSSTTWNAVYADNIYLGGSNISSTLSAASVPGNSGEIIFNNSGSLGSSNLLVVDQSSNHVSIGTGSSLATLQVHDAASPNPLSDTGNPALYQLGLSGNTTSNNGIGIAFGDQNNVGAGIVFDDQGGEAVGSLRFYTKSSLIRGDAPNEILTLKHDGNVGVGVNNPQNSFEVRGSVGITKTATDAGAFNFRTDSNGPTAGSSLGLITFGSTAWPQALISTEAPTDWRLFSNVSGVSRETTMSFSITKDNDFRTTEMLKINKDGANFYDDISSTGDIISSGQVSGNTGSFTTSVTSGTYYGDGSNLTGIIVGTLSHDKAVTFNNSGAINTASDLFYKSDRLGVGDFSSSNPSSKLMIKGDFGSGSDPGVLTVQDFSSSPSIVMQGAGGTASSVARTGSGDKIGQISFQGYNSVSSAYEQGALIEAIVEATPSGASGDMPTSIRFSTSSDGSSTPSPRMTISESGNVGIGDMTPSYTLDVNGGGLRSKGSFGGLYLHSDVGEPSTMTKVSTIAMGTTSGVSAASIDTYSLGAWSSTNRPTRMIVSTTDVSESSSKERFTVDYSGNVGIGEFSASGPPAKLTVQGDSSGSAEPGVIILSDVGSSPIIALQRANGTLSSMSEVGYNQEMGEIAFFGYNSSISSMQKGAYVQGVQMGTAGQSSGDMPTELRFGTTADNNGTPSTRMVVSSGGNVGVGENFPSFKLDVKDGSLRSRASFGGVYLHSTTNNPSTTTKVGTVAFGTNDAPSVATISGYSLGSWTSSSKPAYLQFATTPGNSTSPTTRMMISSDGRVGIATASPSRILDVNGDFSCLNANIDANTPILNFNHTGSVVTGTVTSQINMFDQTLIKNRASESWNTTDKGTALDFLTTERGSATPSITMSVSKDTTYFYAPISSTENISTQGRVYGADGGQFDSTLSVNAPLIISNGSTSGYLKTLNARIGNLYDYGATDLKIDLSQSGAVVIPQNDLIVSGQVGGVPLKVDTSVTYGMTLIGTVSGSASAKWLENQGDTGMYVEGYATGSHNTSNSGIATFVNRSQSNSQCVVDIIAGAGAYDSSNANEASVITNLPSTSTNFLRFFSKNKVTFSGSQYAGTPIRVGRVRGDGQGGVDYVTSFTGHHAAIIDKSESLEVGMILSSSGEIWHGSTVSTALPKLKVSGTPSDRTVFGVLSELEGGHEGYMLLSPPKESEMHIEVNSIGEGRVLITNFNGEASNGDYITSSPISGMGMMQGDDLLRSCTVAKITENIDWSKITETITFDGSEHKRYFAACTYHCG